MDSCGHQAFETIGGDLPWQIRDFREVVSSSPARGLHALHQTTLVPRERPLVNASR